MFSEILLFKEEETTIHLKRAATTVPLIETGVGREVPKSSLSSEFIRKF
jgi:hypothetical protein